MWFTLLAEAMKLFDAHNHVQDERLFPDIAGVMRRARDAGVVEMGVKGCCEADWSRVIHISESYDGIRAAFGLHPWFITDRSEAWLKTLEKLLRRHPQASVGEIGIDHRVEERDDADQEAVFLAQLEVARRLERPVTIHCRGAWGRLIDLLDDFGRLPRGMLIHCFGGSAETAMELVKRGAYISFSGSITRPNNRKAGPAIQAMPGDRILIETDAPDIMPSMVEAEFNEPAYLRYVLAKAAELRGISEPDMAHLTVVNARRFYCGPRVD